MPLAPSPADRTRRARLFEAAREQGVPLAAILTSVAVVVGVYLLGKLAYRLRDIVHTNTCLTLILSRGTAQR